MKHNEERSTPQPHQSSTMAANDEGGGGCLHPQCTARFWCCVFKIPERSNKVQSLERERERACARRKRDTCRARVNRRTTFLPGVGPSGCNFLSEMAALYQSQSTE